MNSFILKVAFDRQVIRAKAIQAIHDQNYVERLQKTTGRYGSIMTTLYEYIDSSLKVAAELIAIIFITCLLVVTNINLFLSLIFMNNSWIMRVFKCFIRYGEIKNQGLKILNAVQTR